jgi:hypothetical protein
MRVTIYHSAHYDQVPVPETVEIREADVKSGMIKPGKYGGYTARVTRRMDSHTFIPISEAALIARLIYELIPRPGLRKLGPCNRMQLVAELLDANVMPDHAHPEHFTGFEVECDDGPDEALCRKMLALYTGEAEDGSGVHHLTGEPLIDPEKVDSIVAKYMEPTTHAGHVDHLHTRFQVQKKAS